MKRLISFTIVLFYVSAATAFAEEPGARRAVTFLPAASTAVMLPAPRPLASSIARIKFSSAATPASLVQSTGKSFWRTPWPYVIAGAVVAVIVIAKKGGYGGSCSPPGCDY